MKTYAEIAKELSVSKTAVFKKAKKLPDVIVNHSQTVNGKVFFDAQGVRLIKKAFSQITPQTKSETVNDTSTQTDNALKMAIEALTKQLEEKDKHIASLEKLLDQQQQLQLQSQTLLAPKPNILQRLFAAKK